VSKADWCWLALTVADLPAPAYDATGEPEHVSDRESPRICRLDPIVLTLDRPIRVPAARRHLFVGFWLPDDGRDQAVGFRRFSSVIHKHE
jgi:hypothetical protein